MPLALSSAGFFFSTLSGSVVRGIAVGAPYTETGARFPLEASQFEVIDQRPIEEILGEYIAEGYRFQNFVTPGLRPTP